MEPQRAGRKQLVLASASPRRRELLSLITTDFTVLARDTDEGVPPDYSPAQMVEELAARKARAAFGELASGRAIVIGADTVVFIDGLVLGKPRDAAHGAKMLRRLSGRVHEVFTGVALADEGGCETFVQSARVAFAPLSEARIAAYIATGEPMDKAGAYGIQGKGALLVEGIEGDFYTVMGLPVCKLAEKLAQKAGFPL